MADLTPAEPYQPIACADHERLEYAALTRQWLTLQIVDGDRLADARVLPRDVYTRDGAEWLVAESADGETLRIRLDKVRVLRV